MKTYGKTVWIDLETTGLWPESSRIIELAALYEVGGELVDEFHVYCKPFPDPPAGFDEIERITKITWELLEERGVSDRELYLKFRGWLAEKIDQYDRQDKAVFAGYNSLSFDRPFVQELWKRHNDTYFGSWFVASGIDTMSEILNAARLGYITMPPSLKLENVCRSIFTAPIVFDAHSALADIKATRELQCRLDQARESKDG